MSRMMIDTSDFLVFVKNELISKAKEMQESFLNDFDFYAANFAKESSELIRKIEKAVSDLNRLKRLANEGTDFEPILELEYDLVTSYMVTNERNLAYKFLIKPNEEISFEEAAMMLNLIDEKNDLFEPLLKKYLELTEEGFLLNWKISDYKKSIEDVRQKFLKKILEKVDLEKIILSSPTELLDDLVIRLLKIDFELDPILELVSRRSDATAINIEMPDLRPFRPS